MPTVLAVLMFMVVANFAIMLIRNRARPRDEKGAADDSKQSVQRHDNLVRKLDTEQEEAAKYVERRNRTLELYDEVRKQHENEDEKEDDSD